ncbi:MAG: dihydrodipicolinate synthase family protein [Kiritimatiellaeota bacterium]|nr:dihydrodipicolinate synthase family protein [Kiritimatiellota bacterium]
MQDGFYTALGTPLDEHGKLLSRSLTKQIEDQIAAHVSGLLVMGSMGIQPCIRDAEYPKVVATAVDAVKGACPIMVGVMDNSIGKVMERIRAISGMAIDGVVATTPFYYLTSQDDVVNFFECLARNSPYPVYMYDLPVITKVKIEQATAERLAAHRNIAGIKTGNMTTAKALLNRRDPKTAFDIFYSDLGLHDVAFAYGLKMGLDGMYSVAAPLGADIYRNLKEGNMHGASATLDKILNLRNTMIKAGLWHAYSFALNLLGYEGRHYPDYCAPSDPGDLEKVRELMIEYALI